MGYYHLDKKIERKNTGSVKWDAQKRKFLSNDLTPFWIADMDFAVAPCITEAIRQRVEHPVYGYTLPPVNYRSAICSWFEQRYELMLEPEWILPAAHTVTSLSIALQSVTKPGDACLVLTPAYDSLFQVIRGSGRDILVLQMIEHENHYEVDYQAMERCFAAGVRCLIFCNPHNPVGKAWKREELQRIAALCRQYEVIILSDDVHCDWVLAPWGYVSFLSIPDAADRTVVITSPSKTFNLAGFSVSNFIIPESHLREQVQDSLSNMFVKGPNFLGYIATESAYSKAGDWVDEVRAYVAANSIHMRERLSIEAPELRVFEHESTFLLWLDCRAIDPDSGSICRKLAEKYGISVSNGNLYGKGGAGFVRINIACPRSMIEICLEALIRWYHEETS